MSKKLRHLQEFSNVGWGNVTNPDGKPIDIKIY